MSAPQIPQKTPLIGVLDEITFTLIHLQENELTLQQAPAFEALQAECMDVMHAELLLHIGRAGAQASIIARDTKLDYFVDDLSRTVLTLTKGNRAAALYRQYFANQRPSDIEKPVLGKELEQVTAWIPSLKASPEASLTALGSELEQRVAKANDAVKRRANVEQQNHDFRMGGLRKAFIDKTNALRQETFGVLAKMPHALPEAHLPASFADTFFRHQASAPSAAPLTSEDIKGQIQALQAQIVDLQTELKRVEEQDKADAEAGRARRAVEIGKELEDARKSQAEGEARIVELEKELAKKA